LWSKEREQSGQKKKKTSKKERALDREQLDFILSINCPYRQGKELSNHIHKLIIVIIERKERKSQKKLVGHSALISNTEVPVQAVSGKDAGPDEQGNGR
jgi:hypothetical protein